MARTKTVPIGTQAVIPLALLDEDPAQPRVDFDPVELNKLAESIKAEGVKVPLQVVPVGGRYQVRYGARRKRAAEAAGLTEVPCLVVAQESRLSTLLDQVLENSLRADLQPQDDAAALLIVWLGRQIIAFGGDGEPPEGTVSERIAALTERLCALAGVPDLDAYATSGAVKVPWREVLTSVGRGDWTDDRRKQHLRRIKHLKPEVLDAIAGVPMSAATVKDLGALPAEQQVEVVEKAKANGKPLGDALREELDERKPKKAKAEPEDDDLALVEEPEDTFDPDPSLALLTSSGGKAPKLVTDQVEPERGTPPPAGHDRWSNADFLLLQSALEALQTTIEDAGPRTLTPDQAKRVRAQWDEISRRMSLLLNE